MEKIIISIVITSCIALSISSAQADSPDLRGQGSLINKPITSIGSKPGAAEISLTRGMGIPPPSITKEAPAISRLLKYLPIMSAA